MTNLYVRIDYDDNGSDPDLILPWSIDIELNDDDFPKDDKEFDKAIKKYLVENGYAPTLTNTEDIMPHLHGAAYIGYYAETDL